MGARLASCPTVPLDGPFPHGALFFLSALLALWAARIADGAPAGGTWVEWDRASDHVVCAAHATGAACPKARQLSNGAILLAYHHGESDGNSGSRVTLRRSRDNGAT